MGLIKGYTRSLDYGSGVEIRCLLGFRVQGLGCGFRV